MGYCYFDGCCVEQDPTKAAVLYQLSADQKHPTGQAGLGDCCMLGLGVDRDESKGAALYQQSADQGFADGQFCLGECYLYGHGVEQDHTKAASFFSLAADQGHPQAQASLFEANEALAAEGQRRTAEADQAMQSLLDEEDSTGGVTAGKQASRRRRRIRTREAEVQGRPAPR